MAYQEYVQKAIATGKTYDELPAKVKQAVLLPEWKTRYRLACNHAADAALVTLSPLFAACLMLLITVWSG